MEKKNGPLLQLDTGSVEGGDGEKEKKNLYRASQ